MRPNQLFIVGIGASAGGHDALKGLFEHLSPNLPAAYVVVTHLLRTHYSHLSNIIARYTTMPVVRINGLTTVLPGQVYVLPENVVIKIRNGIIRPEQRPAEAGINRSIDIFFESLAEDQTDKAIGVILSGMGSDGAKGVMKIHEMGGAVMVQEPASADFSSMPWAAIIKDNPDFIVPPPQMASKLQLLMRQRTTVRSNT